LVYIDYYNNNILSIKLIKKNNFKNTEPPTTKKQQPPSIKIEKNEDFLFTEKQAFLSLCLNKHLQMIPTIKGALKTKIGTEKDNGDEWSIILYLWPG
jgi:hypothetical protein